MADWLRRGIAVSSVSVFLFAAGAAVGDSASDQRQAEIEALSDLVEAGDAEGSDLLRLAYLLEQQGDGDLAAAVERTGYQIDPTLAIDDAAGPIATPRGAIGPDVVVCNMAQARQWTSPSVGGSGPIENGTIRVYSFGTTSKNVGDQTLDWIEFSQNKPLIAQSVYRMIDGRIEQVGFAWLKHGFCAINTTLCGSCTPAEPGCPDELAPGCSDPYSSSTNGTHSRLGPHAEVNPVTGAHEVFHDTPGTGIDDGRIRLHVDLLTSVSSNPDVRLFFEGAYIHPQDAAAGNAMNNATYIEALVLGAEQDLNPNFVPNEPRIGLPAVYALQEFDPTAMVSAVDVPDDGRFHIASNAVRTGTGSWLYTYAVHNFNSDRAAHAFMVETSAVAAATNPWFKDVEYRDGDGVGGVNYDGTDWSPTIGAETIEWTCPETFAENDNANALRWATTYNFSFETNSPPTERQATITLFKPGSPSEVTAAVLAPQRIPGDVNGDGEIASDDLALLLGSWASDSESTDIDGDGLTGSTDLALLLGSWTP